ncbi:hypothetical protein MICAE_280004 [Microcystis aeruginosa PCC 9806]|jgi:hypothetical protein|nr:hypothetical protein [Microcystis aeruginosa]CCI14462.1 hypothetical protein MICAE_280004 [Microcystis aeruginosa PCC 9806]
MQEAKGVINNQFLITGFSIAVSCQYSEDSPDEKIFTTTDERGFLPYTPHPTPTFKSGDYFYLQFPLPNSHFPLSDSF